MPVVLGLDNISNGGLKIQSPATKLSLSAEPLYTQSIEEIIKYYLTPPKLKMEMETEGGSMCIVSQT